MYVGSRLSRVTRVGAVAFALAAAAALGTAVGSAGGPYDEWGCPLERIGHSIFEPAEGGGYASPEETLAALAPFLAADGPLPESDYARALASRAGEDRYDLDTGKLFVRGMVETRIALRQLADGTWTIDNLHQCMRPPSPEEASPYPTPGLTGEGPAAAQIIPVGSFPRALVVGDGLLWVSIQDDGADSVVAGIEPASGAVERSIPVETAPDHLALGLGSLWGTVEGPGGPLLRIDPEQSEVTATVPMPGYYLQDIASDGSTVWAALVDVDDGTHSVGMIDPALNKVVSIVPLPRFIVDLQVSEGVLWVLDSETRGNGIVGDGQVTRLDTMSGEVLGSTDVGATGIHLLVTSDGVWVQSWLSSHSDVGTGAEDRLVALRLSQTTGEVVASPIPTDGGFSPFGFDGVGVWFYGQDSRDGFDLSRLNTDSLSIDMRLDLDAEPTDAVLDAQTGSIWIANYQDSVTRVTLSS